LGTVTYLLNIAIHACTNHLWYLLLTLLFAATPHPDIAQERGQVGGATQEPTEYDVSQNCE